MLVWADQARAVALKHKSGLIFKRFVTMVAALQVCRCQHCRPEQRAKGSCQGPVLYQCAGPVLLQELCPHGEEDWGLVQAGPDESCGRILTGLNFSTLHLQIVNRTNTINGRPYKTDPTILGFDVMNE